MGTKKYIKTTQELDKKLAAEFETSEKTVYNAKYYLTDSYLAKEIRRRALEEGGVLMQAVEASPKDGRDETASCLDCLLAKYPPCNKGIPCCKCEKKQNECNSWQPCPKKEGKEEVEL